MCRIFQGSSCAALSDSAIRTPFSPQGNAQHLHRYGIAHMDRVVGTLHAAPRQFGQVNHAFHAGGQFDKSPERRQAADRALAGIALMSVRQNLFKRRGAFAFQQITARNHNVAAVVFQFGDQKGVGLADARFQDRSADASPSDCPGRTRDAS